MPELESTGATELESYRQLAEMASAVIGMNVAGITHEESLMRPQPAGNCLNWVVGHLLWAYNNLLPGLGQEPVLPPGSLDRYKRGQPPLERDGDAIEFGTLLAAWTEAAARVDAGLAALAPEALDAPGVTTGSDARDETYRISLNTLMFHQAYHAGQTGVLRRLVGRAGAIT